ncbi:MAG: lysophospholipid acyltransferase family protein [Deltaproteobacteria bacterium]|nr:lysophospholipid acyltransferase family protein [Deltaproteobacteria bacterium]
MRWLLRFVFNRLLITFIVWFVYRTTRVCWVNRHILEERQPAGGPYLAAVWHNTLLYFVPLLAPFTFHGLVSRSRDGDDIAWVMARFGFPVLRGSSSTGGAAALREGLRLLSQGQNVIFTPDGPRGPRYVLKSGLVALARKKQVPIIPIVYSAPKRWELGSWDRMKLPKPFSTVTVIVGAPIYPGQEGAGLEDDRLRVEREMRGLLLKAEQFTGARDRFFDPMLFQGSENSGDETSGKESL